MDGWIRLVSRMHTTLLTGITLNTVHKDGFDWLVECIQRYLQESLSERWMDGFDWIVDTLIC